MLREWQHGAAPSADGGGGEDDGRLPKPPASGAPMTPTLALLVGLLAMATGALLLLLLGRREAGHGTKRTASLPPQFLCPITGELMREPMTTSDGHAFERSAIERWLATHSTSPMTGMPLGHTSLAPAHALRQLIENATGVRPED